jgi:hypothetical protein
MAAEYDSKRSRAMGNQLDDHWPYFWTPFFISLTLHIPSAIYLSIFHKGCYPYYYLPNLRHIHGYALCYPISHFLSLFFETSCSYFSFFWVLDYLQFLSITIQILSLSTNIPMAIMTMVLTCTVVPDNITAYVHFSFPFISLPFSSAFSLFVHATVGIGNWELCDMGYFFSK